MKYSEETYKFMGLRVRVRRESVQLSPYQPSQSVKSVKSVVKTHGGGEGLEG